MNEVRMETVQVWMLVVVVASSFVESFKGSFFGHLAAPFSLSICG